MNFYIPYDDNVDEAETYWVNSPSGFQSARDGPTNDYKYNDNYDNEEEAKQWVDGTLKKLCWLIIFVKFDILFKTFFFQNRAN